MTKNAEVATPVVLQRLRGIADIVRDINGTVAELAPELAALAEKRDAALKALIVASCEREDDEELAIAEMRAAAAAYERARDEWALADRELRSARKRARDMSDRIIEVLDESRQGDLFTAPPVDSPAAAIFVSDIVGSRRAARLDPFRVYTVADMIEQEHHVRDFFKGAEDDEIADDGASLTLEVVEEVMGVAIERGWCRDPAPKSKGKTKSEERARRIDDPLTLDGRPPHIIAAIRSVFDDLGREPTVQDLAVYINDEGVGWHRPLKGVGALTARSVERELREHGCVVENFQ